MTVPESNAVAYSIVSILRSETMRTPFTGVGTALVTPFTKDGSLDEAAVRRLARRQIDAGIHFLSPCGTTGEAPTLSHAREAPRRRARRRGGGGARAGARRRRRLRHARDDRARPRHRADRRRRHSVGHAVLQQADAGRPLPALTRRSPNRHAAADRALQRAGPHRRQHRRADRRSPRPPIPNIVGVKEASANVVQMCEIVASDAGRFHAAERRRSADGGGDGDRRPRRHLA